MHRTAKGLYIQTIFAKLVWLLSSACCLRSEIGISMDGFRHIVEVLTPEESAAALYMLIDGLQPKDSGKFMTYKGDELPF